MGISPAVGPPPAAGVGPLVGPGRNARPSRRRMVAPETRRLVMKSTVLKHLRVRLAGWLTGSFIITILGVAGAAALSALVLDAALDLSESSRVAAPWVLGVFVVAFLVAGFWAWRRIDERRVGQLFERTQPALGNR